MDSSARRASQEELQQIARFNDTQVVFRDDVTLHRLIEEQVEKKASQIAVICDHDTTFGKPFLTFAELNDKANQLAHALRANGVGPGEIVGMLVERSFGMMLGILGILKAGGAYLPLSPENPPDRLEFILNDAAAKLLLVQDKTQKKLKFNGKLIRIDDPLIYQGSSENSLSGSSRDLAYVIYTSGSTGKPKGVMIEHRSVVNRLAWMQHEYPINGNDVLLQKTPYYFDVSVWEIFWWAIYGSKLCFMPPGMEGNPLALLKMIRKHQISVLHFVPSMLNVFLDYLDSKGAEVREDLSSTRRVFASGEALSPSHVKKFNRVWARGSDTLLTNLYGPTEATVDVTYFECPRNGDVPKVPIGRPIHNTRMYVMRDGYEVGIGVEGEICIGGVGLARGYLNNPELTNAKFIESPTRPGERIYKTGDIGQWLEDGNIEYVGREDFQIKIRGLRIELGEIENTIRDYSEVQDAVVVVKSYSENVVLIIAYVVCKSSINFAELKLFLSQRLPSYMVPNHFERLETIPLSPSGKADRKALPEIELGKRP